MNANALIWERKLAKVKDPKKRIAILMDLADLYHRTDAEKTISFADQIIALAKENALEDQELDGLLLKADAAFFKGDYLLSIEEYRSIIARCEALENEKTKSIMLQWFSMPLSAIGKYEEVIDILTEAEAIQRKNKMWMHQASSLQKKALVYYKLSDYKQALSLCRKALQLLNRHPQIKIEAITLGIMGRIYSELEDYENAVEVYNKEIRLYEQSQNDFGLSVALGNLGNMYCKMKSYALALEYMKRALELQQEQHNTNHRAISCSNIAALMLAGSQIEQAHQYSLEALRLADTIQNTYTTIVVYLQYGKLLNETGKHELATQYLLHALSTVDGSERLGEQCELYMEIVKAYEALHNDASALYYHKRLLQTQELYLRKKMDKDIRLLQLKSSLSFQKQEKQLLESRISTLERQLMKKQSEIAELSMKALSENHFLDSIRNDVSQALPHNNELTKKLKSVIKKVGAHLDSNYSDHKLRQLRDSTPVEFERSLINEWPSLTKMERKICSLIKLELNSKEISEVLCISIRTIEGHRLNIRKKMKLSEQETISDRLSHISEIS